jgi:CDP-paratose 2-epimerase
MRVFITGICGFAGNAIARGLLETMDGVKIVGLDNFSRRGSETNKGPLEEKGIEVRRGDIRRPEDIEGAGAADWVIDCAANPSVLAGADGVTGPRDLLDHNLVGTMNLLEYCRVRGAGFILLSTSRVYSITPLAGMKVDVVDGAFAPRIEVPSPALSARGITEEFSTEPPLSLYGSSKRCSELLALVYGGMFGFPVRINRCGVLAGAGQFGKADQGIFSYWIHAWARRRGLKYIGFGGTGHQVRDCLHPRDIVPLLARQMREPGRAVAAVQNIAGGAGNAMSLARLSEWCRDRLGAHTVEPELAARAFDIPWMVLDCARAERDWEWRPTTRLEDILEEIRAHALSNPDWLGMTS